MKLNCVLLAIAALSIVVPVYASLSLDGTNGLSYIDAAEDLLEGVPSPSEIKEARRRFVLATVVDPSLLRSSILGLISIETDPLRRKRLVSVLPKSKSLISKVITTVQETRPIADQDSILKACKTLQKLRIDGQVMIHKEEVPKIQRELLIYATLDLSETLKKSIHGTTRLPTSDSTVNETLLAELKLLGGPSQWSTAVLIEGDIPLGSGGQIDLAAMMGVDAAKIIYKGGRWQLPKK
ncbi:MAG: hypothetical protein QF444_00380 [Phycisphaerales bacterium]|jgi:hypothetical protein|nr:hypothetical protein [Phycisphaerales bacterium]